MIFLAPLIYLNDMEKYTLAVGLVMLKASQGSTLDMGANDGGRPFGSHSNFYPVFDLSKIFCSGCGDERTERIEVLRILYGSIKTNMEEKLCFRN